MPDQQPIDWGAVLDAVRSNPQVAREISRRLTPEQAQQFVEYQKQAVKPMNPGGDNTAISVGDVGVGIGDVVGGGLIGKAAGPAVGKALSNPLVGGTIAGIEGYRRGGPLQGLEWGLGGALGQKVGGPLIGKILDSTLPGGEGAAGEAVAARPTVQRRSFNSAGGKPPTPSGEGGIGGPSNPTGTTPSADVPSAPGDTPVASVPPSRTSSPIEASGEPGGAPSEDSILSNQAVKERLDLKRRPINMPSDTRMDELLTKFGGTGPAESPSDQLGSRFDTWLRQNPGGFKGGKLDTSAEDLASSLGPGTVQPGSLKQMPFPRGSGGAEKALRSRANFLDSLQKQYTRDPGLIRDDQLRAILEDMMKTRSQ